MNDERTLWRKLLAVEEPWSVLDCQADGSRRRHDVWIGLEAPRGWFGLGRGKAPPCAPAVSWRHVDFGDWEIHVHVSAPASADLSRLPWAGETDLPFTRALNQQVFTFLREGCSLQSICALLKLPITELWRFRYAIDSGRWAAGDSVPTDANRAAAGSGAANAPPTAAPGVAGAASAPGVPDVTHPVWAALLDGSHQIDVRVLGLKLLLTRLRSQFELISDSEVRALKLREFHRYFIKNKHLLAHELAQLRDE